MLDHSQTSSRAELVIVGTGIEAGAQTTLGARAAIESADIVLFAAADRETADWIRAHNQSAQPFDYDTSQRRRRPVYEAMARRILAELDTGRRVCAAFYGHPGVFAYASHLAIRCARERGFEARMLPAVSAEDCLIADFGLDPAALGCQSFEATDFLIRPRAFDVHTTLVLWQVGLIGSLGFWSPEQDCSQGLALLMATLEGRYGSSHRCYVYEASRDGRTPPRISPTPIAELGSASLTALSTLLVPAKGPAPLDRSVMARLGIELA